MERPELNALQERFCLEYVTDPRRVAKSAAIRAGYSEKTAESQASRLLRQVKVKSRVRELEMEALETAGYDRETLRAAVMRELVRIAKSDITDVVAISPSPEDQSRTDALRAHAEACGGQFPLDFGGVLVYPTGPMAADVTAAIRSIKQTKEGISVELHDKLSALKTLAEITELVRAPQTNVAVTVGGFLAALEGTPEGAKGEDPPVPPPAPEETPP